MYETIKKIKKIKKPIKMEPCWDWYTLLPSRNHPQKNPSVAEAGRGRGVATVGGRGSGPGGGFFSFRTGISGISGEEKKRWVEILDWVVSHIVYVHPYLGK